MNKIFFAILAVIFLVTVQVSFLSAWPMPVRALQLVLTLVIFITTTIGYKAGLWWAFGSGLLLELYTLGFFGLATLSLLATVVVTNFLFVHFFTNRSLYPILSLGVIGTVCYNLIFIVLSNLIAIFSAKIVLLTLDFNYFVYLAWQIGLNTLILFIIFLIFQRIVSSLRPNNIVLP